MAERADIRDAVERRAGDRCEYCQMPRRLYRTPFHVEHVIARQHGGLTALENLAWACSHCNLHKGPNIAGVDPETQAIVPLFHPRQDRWQDHFRCEDGRIIGLSAAARATVIILDLNEPLFVEVRAELMADGLYPPPADLA